VKVASSSGVAPVAPAASKSALKTFTNSLGMEFILIPAGSFMMGDVFDGAYDDESPVHRVKISRPFYLGKYAVTQEQWVAVTGKNPSVIKERKHPVETVSWDEVQTFIQRLNEPEGTNRYRLPTEAEWEYAVRAGTTSAYSFGDNANQLEHYAWYEDNSNKQTHPVGQKQPNPWGLYDMHGNVWEWVQDWYGEYSQSAVTDPTGPSGGDGRVLRGGSWSSNARYLRSANRSNYAPDNRYECLGFRLALSPGH
jgi:formylglycine-generating enzyme required for sulfatase activity